MNSAVSENIRRLNEAMAESGVPTEDRIVYSCERLRWETNSTNPDLLEYIAHLNGEEA